MIELRNMIGSRGGGGRNLQLIPKVSRRANSPSRLLGVFLGDLCDIRGKHRFHELDNCNSGLGYTLFSCQPLAKKKVSEVQRLLN